MYRANIESRKAMWARAEVFWESPAGTPNRAPAIIEDKSSAGVCVRLKAPIAVGTDLTVVWARERFSGKAKNCRTDGSEYVVGIQRDAAHNPAQPTPAPKPATVEPKAVTPAPKPEPIRAAALVPPASIPQPQKVASAPPENHDSSRSGRAEPYQSPVSAAAPGNERNSMQSKGFFSKFQKHEQSGPDTADLGQSTEVPVNKPANQSDANNPARPEPQGDLLSCEDIYHASGILTGTSKYDITKVAEMLNSKHLRDLSKEARRASLLMALEAAGTHIEEVLQDATRRQHALDTYETGQQKQLEEFEARRTRENAQIQAELERLTAHYAIRTERNLEHVAREKAAFRNWQAAKEQESKRIAEAVALCGKQSAPETPAEQVSGAPRAVAAAMLFQS